MNIQPTDIYNRFIHALPIQEKITKANFWLEEIQSRRNSIRNKFNISPGDPRFNKKLILKSPETKGKEQHVTDQTRRFERDKVRVDELVKQSNRSIITVSSTFPWNIFPNTIDVEENRVTFIFRQFLTSQSHSLDIKDISNVFIESGVFFATLQVVSRTFVQNDIKINYLSKGQAIKVKRVIEGLRTFNHNNIDTSSYSVDELVDKLCELNITR